MVSVLVSVADHSAPKSLLHTQLELEARVGIEPTHTAFAEPRLTTWLPRLSAEEGYHNEARPKRKHREQMSQKAELLKLRFAKRFVR